MKKFLMQQFNEDMLSKQFEYNWPYELMMNLLMSFLVIVALHFRERCLLFLWWEGYMYEPPQLVTKYLLCGFYYVILLGYY